MVMKKWRQKNTGEHEIQVKIDELILHGFNLSDRYVIGESIKAELGRLFNNADIQLISKKNAAVNSINAGSFTISQGSNSVMTGKRTAGAVYNGIINNVNNRNSNE